MKSYLFLYVFSILYFSPVLITAQQINLDQQSDYINTENLALNSDGNVESFYPEGLELSPINVGNEQKNAGTKVLSHFDVNLLNALINIKGNAVTAKGFTNNYIVNLGNTLQFFEKPPTANANFSNFEFKRIQGISYWLIRRWEF